MDNRAFWNDRYRVLPELGSGPGSRAYAAWRKRTLIEQTIARDGVRSIVDIGCGDVYWMPADAAGVSYLGVDVAEYVLAANRSRFPRAEFVVHDIAAAPLARGADLVVCCDVLIHQIERERFGACLANVLASTRQRALISYLTPAGTPEPAFDDAPAEVLAQERALLDFLQHAEFPRAQTANHGELPDWVARVMPQASVRAVASYPRQTVYEIVAG